MIFQATCDWVLDASPHTGQPKTSTLRLANPTQLFYWMHLGNYPALSPTDWYETEALRGVEVTHVLSGPPDDPRSRIVHAKGMHRTIQPGRGQHGRGFFEIERMYLLRPCDLTALDLWREGFVTPEQFQAVWEALHGPGKLEVLCWLIQFKLIKGRKAGA